MASSNENTKLSLPSNGVIVANVPEDSDSLRGFGLQFTYNFYTQDESKVQADRSDMIDESGFVSPYAGQQEPFVDDSVSTIPRWIDIRLPRLKRAQRRVYTYRTYRNEDFGGALAVDNSAQPRSEFDADIRSIWSKFNNERVSGKSLVDLVNFEEELNLGLVDVKVSDGSMAQDIETLSLLREFLDEELESTTFTADSTSRVTMQEQLVNKATGGGDFPLVSDRVASKILRPVFAQKLSVRKSSGGRARAPSPGDDVELLKNVHTNIAISSDLVKSVFLNAIQDPASSEGLDIAQAFAATVNASRQTGMRALLSGDDFPEAEVARDMITITRSDYERELKLLDVGETTNDRTDHSFRIYPLGFLIGRFETGILQGGSVGRAFSYFEPARNFSLRRKIRDAGVTYGNRYRYVLRRLFAVKSYMKVSDMSSVYKEATYLIASRLFDPPKNRISATYVTAPLPPTDLSFNYDFSTRALNIEWSVRPRRNSPPPVDFMLFRRDDITSPFQLVETVRTARISTKQFVQGPANVVLYDPRELGSGAQKRFVTDSEFTQGISKIYSLVAVDPHGVVSNYSQQFRVNFDKSRRKLDVDLVSPSGAPLQYPNFFLTRAQGGFSRTHVIGDFSNSLLSSMGKVSNAERMTIFFAPDVASVSYDGLDDDGNEVTVNTESPYVTIPTSQATSAAPLSENSYYFSLINLDDEESVATRIRIVGDQ